MDLTQLALHASGETTHRGDPYFEFTYDYPQVHHLVALLGITNVEYREMDDRTIVTVIYAGEEEDVDFAVEPSAVAPFKTAVARYNPHFRRN